MTKWTGSILIPGTAIGVEFDLPEDVGSIIPGTPPCRRWIAAAAAEAVWPHFDLWIPDRTTIVCLMKDGVVYGTKEPSKQAAVFMTKIDTALVGTGGPIPYIFRRQL